MNHVTNMDESCHAHGDKSCHEYGSVMSRTWMSHVTHTDWSYERVSENMLPLGSVHCVEAAAAHSSCHAHTL